MKKQRISMLIDFKVYTEMRKIQADKIKKTKRNVSFSEIIQDLVKIGMGK